MNHNFKYPNESVFPPTYENELLREYIKPQYIYVYMDLFNYLKNVFHLQHFQNET